jgi:competence ComEA-like helix-hairpin-helix protein
MRREVRAEVEAELGESSQTVAGIPQGEVEKRIEMETRRLEAEAEAVAKRAAADARKQADEDLKRMRAERDDAVKKLRAAESELKKAKASQPQPAAKPAEKQTAKPGQPAPPMPTRKPAQPKPPKPVKEPEPEEELELTGPVDLNQATFEQLRALGFSAAQANRVIAYRERLGGYKAVDDLETVPGVQREFVTKLKDRLQV